MSLGAGVTWKRSLQQGRYSQIRRNPPWTGGSTWKLTGDSYVTSLTNNGGTIDQAAGDAPRRQLKPGAGLPLLEVGRTRF